MSYEFFYQIVSFSDADKVPLFLQLSDAFLKGPAQCNAMGAEIRKVEPTELLQTLDAISQTIVTAVEVRKSFSIGDCDDVSAANVGSPSRKFFSSL